MDKSGLIEFLGIRYFDVVPFQLSVFLENGLPISKIVH
jgi:hypothetical protein